MPQNCVDLLTSEQLEEVKRMIHDVCPAQYGGYVLMELREAEGLSFNDLLLILQRPKIPGDSASIPLDAKIRDVDCIWLSGYQDISSPQGLQRRIEYPVRDAVLSLREKGVDTFWSSANYKNVGRYAFIGVKNLSDENRAILLNDNLYSAEWVDGKFLMRVPVGIETTVREVKFQMEHMVKRMRNQYPVYRIFVNAFLGYSNFGLASSGIMLPMEEITVR